MSKETGGAHRRLLLLLLLAVLFALYASSFPGMRTSNDGSHYALVRAMADGRVSIDGYEEYTRFVDYSSRNGHYYSDKPPGVSVLALPLYEIGRLLGGDDASSRAPAPDLVRRADPANALVPPLEEWTANLLVALAGAATVALVYLTARELEAGVGASVFVAAAVGLGTMVWRYSTAFYAHAVSAALVMTAVYLAARSFTRQGRAELAWLGVVAGVSVAVDYTNGLPMAGIVLAVVIGRARRGVPSVARDLAAIAAMALVPIALLAAYQWSAFGSPFRTSYQYKALERFAFSHSFLESYSAPLTHLWPLLFNSRWGVVAWCPLLLLTPFTLWYLARRNLARALLLILASVPLIILTAKFLTPEGGATQDARYVTPALAPLLVSVAVPLTKMASRRRRRVAWCVAALLAGGSVALQAARLLLMPAHRERVIGGPSIIRSTTIDVRAAVRSFVQDAFPSIRFAPAALVVGALVAWAIWMVCGRRSPWASGTNSSARAIADSVRTATSR